MYDLTAKLCQIQAEYGVPISTNEYLREMLHPGLVEVVYEWARGMPFVEIMKLTTVSEGSIVRCIMRLDETCRELMSAAQHIGDTALYQKMEKASEMIKRDVVFHGSLYL